MSGRYPQARSDQSKAHAMFTAFATAAAAPVHGQYVPAPPRYTVVYDNPTGAGGVDPATGRPYPAVGQYADTNTNTVHTTRGYSRRLIAQDVGQLVAYNVLTPGDRNYFSALLGSDPGSWQATGGASPGRQSAAEVFSNYYAVAATGGLPAGESLVWGETPIDPHVLHRFTAAISRLGRRRGLRPYAS